MALILTLPEGQAFRVRLGQVERRVEVKKVLGPRGFVLELDDGDLFEIVDDRSAEVLPNVRISAGERGDGTEARLAIEAPRSIPIVRERATRR